MQYTVIDSTVSMKAQPCTFLTLPPAIREQIYYHAGLICNYDIDFNGRTPYYTCCACSAAFQTSYNLLPTCRTIYADASGMVYSTNRFVIQYSDYQTLKGLRNLSPQSIAYLTQLTVYLNNILSPNTPLENASEGGIAEWQSTAPYITAHIRSSHLRMYFAGDVDGLKIAMDALMPFRNTLMLEDCGIRLSSQPGPLLQDLAQSTAMQVMGFQQCSNHAKSPFQFLDLPRELRFQILENTDLVTSFCEVEGNPKRNYYLHYTWRCGWPDFEAGPGCIPNEYCMCRFDKDWIEELWSLKWQTPFCRRYHAAFLSSCHCWSPPTSLFPVCKHMQEDAQVVFFSRNRFVTVPSGGPTQPVESTGISIFLKEAVPYRAIHFLTSVEIVFPPFHGDYLRPEPATEIGFKLSTTRGRFSICLCSPCGSSGQITFLTQDSSLIFEPL